MAVICKCTYGFVIDHNLGVSRAFKKGTALKSGGTISMKNACLREELFQIDEPFLMDSQYTAMQNRIEGIMRKDGNKKKRKAANETCDDRFLEYHKKISDTILSAYKTLIHLAREEKYFKSDRKSKTSVQSNSQQDLKGCQLVASEHSTDLHTKCSEGSTSQGSSSVSCDRDQGNNKIARDMASRLHGPGDSLADLCHERKDGKIPRHTLKLTEEMMLWDIDPVNQCYINDCGHPAVFHFNGSSYIVPTNSTFLLTDFSIIESLTLVNDFKPFHCIVIDPPWVNKSVKRKKKYKALANEDFLKIPVNSLAADKALVVVWVTNKMKHVDFIKDELFPAWNVQYLTEWYWLKVTTSGEMVCDINSDHKKPYELMIIGRYNTEESVSVSESQSVCSDVSCRSLPANQTIISVPCALHSMKPPLNDILKEYLPENAQCLELFARNLWPGWTNWGNEVLLHQHTDFYKLEDT